MLFGLFNRFSIRHRYIGRHRAKSIWARTRPEAEPAGA